VKDREGSVGSHEQTVPREKNRVHHRIKQSPAGPGQEGKGEEQSPEKGMSLRKKFDGKGGTRLLSILGGSIAAERGREEEVKKTPLSFLGNCVHEDRIPGTVKKECQA